MCKEETRRLIQKYCESTGIKPIDLARKSGVHPSTMHRIMSGEVGISAPTAQALERTTNGALLAVQLLQLIPEGYELRRTNAA